jgi:hypothetical protein
MRRVALDALHQRPTLVKGIGIDDRLRRLAELQHAPA